MDIIPLIDRIGEAPTGALFGLLTGLVFGVAAQRSRFCLRAATVEFARRQMGPSVAVWLLTFSTALVWVQGATLLGLFRPEDARMMAVTGSWSGAIFGGLMFGVGMVLARGCSGRLLVLAATGNLRSVVSGLIFAVVAQMSLHGWLSPVRTEIAQLWTTPGGANVNLLTLLHLPRGSGLAIGLALAVLALVISRRNRIGPGRLVFASGVGFSVALGWVLTFTLAQSAFEPVTVSSATFTGPSANTLMFFLTEHPVLEFDVGLVPGVVLGAFAASWLKGEFRFQGFENEANMRRAFTGAAFMGFGGMLAGGCAIGAGVTGGSIFVGTAWLALFFMWVGAMATDRLIDQRATPAGLPA
ncbi:YeeE/YedE family protein [Maritimibacter sp. DP1N21-5]|uniref:YeeE/YedE family protein n=1 Tax=Maritimibacter sp. DP1N21-5 TaxID=2836867 RepID=UPI001C4556ED|nr:YeeE/YedE family protein [Maritimibacter sp. DP1N21-5]MBV7407562.1 YeeE/YedE family protein [Maritimibacter sp. DP1N21-5]